MQACGKPIEAALSLAHEAYCAWGTATASKIHTFSISRLKAELEWIAQHEISFVYGASANFGQLQRDVEIAEILADVRRRYGYPKKFFTNTAKNATDRIFHISKILHDVGLAKGATLSPQTWDRETLVNIKRSNIKPKTYMDLQQLFTAANIPTYSEIILGLPGETLDSFCRGIDAEIDMGQLDGLAIYPCRVLPGTEMSNPDYRKAHGIKTLFTPILANHSDLHAATTGPIEYEETIVETSTMPHLDWIKANGISWFVQAFFCLGLARHPLMWLKARYGIKTTDFARWALDEEMTDCPLFTNEVRRLNRHLALTLVGDPEFPNDGIEWAPALRWPIEEACWLGLMSARDAWFSELRTMIEVFCCKRGLSDPHDPTERNISDAINELHAKLRHWTTDAVYWAPGEFAKHRLWFGRRGDGLVIK